MIVDIYTKIMDILVELAEDLDIRYRHELARGTDNQCIRVVLLDTEKNRQKNMYSEIKDFEKKVNGILENMVNNTDVTSIEIEEIEKTHKNILDMRNKKDQTTEQSKMLMLENQKNNFDALFSP